MLNRSASLAMSTCVLKALPGKLDIKRHSPSILYHPLGQIFILQYQDEEEGGDEAVVADVVVEEELKSYQWLTLKLSTEGEVETVEQD